MASDISTSISLQVSPATQQPRVKPEPAVIKTDGRQTVASNIEQKLPVAEQQDEVKESRKKLEENVSKLNDYVQKLERDLQFSIDEVSGRTVIKVLDSENDQVIRQFPSEEMLAIVHFFAEMAESNVKPGKTGILLQEQV